DDKQFAVRRDIEISHAGKWLNDPAYWQRYRFSRHDRRLGANVQCQISVWASQIYHLLAVRRPDRHPATFGRDLVFRIESLERTNENLRDRALLSRGVCQPSAIRRECRRRLDQIWRFWERPWFGLPVERKDPDARCLPARIEVRKCVARRIHGERNI